MAKQDDFYIGYLEKAPGKLGKFVRGKIYLLLGIIFLAAVLFSLGQSAFVNSTFELGNIREIRGTFYHAPYPTLRVKLNDHYSKDILLVGFGKFGMDQSFQMAGLQDQLPKDGSELVLKGTMIYYDGKALFQTEPNLEGTYDVKDWSPFKLSMESRGGRVLTGEIVDPKCYFGVMKPGEGKIHRSCATRCLSGGIPPVLLTIDQKGYHEYYILTDPQGNKLGKEILQFVGKPSMLEGELFEQGEWKQLRIDPAEIRVLSQSSEIYQ